LFLDVLLYINIIPIEVKQSEDIELHFGRGGGNVHEYLVGVRLAEGSKNMVKLFISHF
jgi:hypothetical protein